MQTPEPWFVDPVAGTYIMIAPAAGNRLVARFYDKDDADRVRLLVHEFAGVPTDNLHGLVAEVRTVLQRCQCSLHDLGAMPGLCADVDALLNRIGRE